MIYSWLSFRTTIWIVISITEWKKKNSPRWIFFPSRNKWFSLQHDRWERGQKGRGEIYRILHLFLFEEGDLNSIINNHIGTDSIGYVIEGGSFVSILIDIHYFGLYPGISYRSIYRWYILYQSLIYTVLIDWRRIE